MIEDWHVDENGILEDIYGEPIAQDAHSDALQPAVAPTGQRVASQVIPAREGQQGAN